MRSGTRVVGITIGSAALVLSGIGIASASGGGGAAHRHDTVHVAQAAGSAAALPVDPTADEGVFTPITPCRIVDTRIHGGLLKAARSFEIGGTTGFTNQGGSSSGCGIPIGATAVAADLGATAEVAHGFLRAWPVGAPVPVSSVLNFSKKTSIANEVTLAINTTSGLALKVAASQKTQVTIDITGYYQNQISADILSDGMFFNHTSRVVSVAHTTGTGLYVVTVDRPTEVCSAQATAVELGFVASAITESANTVDVRTWNLVGGVATATDTEFNLTLHC